MPKNSFEPIFYNARCRAKHNIRAMAIKLKTSVSYLSAIECGDEKPTNKLIHDFVRHYPLPSDDLTALLSAIDQRDVEASDGKR